MDSATMAPIWNMTPTTLKLISPKEAMATPMVTRIMLEKMGHEKVSVLNTQPMEKTATGMSALSIWMKLTDR